MLNLNDLEQLVAFADCGTLSHAAEALHISQPTITRTMQRLEEDFGAPLFERGRNRIALNATGTRAVEHARKLLFEAEQAVRAVQAFDRSQRVISIASCAPAPLWSLLPELAACFPENTLSSRVMDTPEVRTALLTDDCSLGILPHACESRDFICAPYMHEVLSVTVPLSHPLAKEERLTFDQLNGHNCLLRDELGFWSVLVRARMPASRFLVQTDAFAFDELVRHSTLLSFVSNLANPQNITPPGRTVLPIDEPEVDITYYLAAAPKHRTLLEAVAKKNDRHDLS